jgi:hypothetical protein
MPLRRTSGQCTHRSGDVEEVAGVRPATTTTGNADCRRYLSGRRPAWPMINGTDRPGGALASITAV